MPAFLSYLGPMLALSALLLITGNVAAVEIWVVTDAHHPVAGAQAADRIIQLDAAQTIEAELSAQLPDDPQQAAVLVQRRLNERGHALQQQLREAYQGVTDAWSLGITSIPRARDARSRVPGSCANIWCASRPTRTAIST